MVFERPNHGCPSRNLASLSSGRENRSPKIFFAITGVPFASINKNTSRVITQSRKPLCDLGAVSSLLSGLSHQAANAGAPPLAAEDPRGRIVMRFRLVPSPRPLFCPVPMVA